MFHIQLRQFPHKACHFNMTDQELLALMGPWVLEQWIEVGERKWNPHQAQLTIVEGPHLEVEDLSMGRGWASAQHRGKDVTEQVLEQVKASLQTPQGAGPQGAGPQGAGPRGAGPRGAGPRGAGPRGDVPAATHSAPPGARAPLDDGPVTEEPGEESGEELGEELRALLGDDPEGLLQAWRLAAGRRPELSPSECLALAEEALRSLGSSTH